MGHLPIPLYALTTDPCQGHSDPKISTIGLVGLLVVFVLKPQKPVFSIQSVRVDAYKLNVYSNSTLFASSVATLVLNASNPNKIGLEYSPSRLQLNLEGLPLAVIRVPKFFQPPHSKNVSLTTRVLIPCVNVTQVMGGEYWLQDQKGNNIVPMKLLGDIKVSLHFFHITLPKIKVALDCDINFDYRGLAFINEAYSNKATAENLIASLSNDSKSFVKKCTVAIYV
ncbi:Late embryogenesis abundant protein, LEA-14 [Corchorus capsularis]|uniref:Late embryogenesis abundant protein, LEA-14 n=1 Tax=Corchorus capsularis TaxID=210143 RepID=A0A1R3HJK7_COCAP|nr:Late embryogenesis abundant protein, LEA-14 [Corchorus capsularis]